MEIVLFLAPAQNIQVFVSVYVIDADEDESASVKAVTAIEVTRKCSETTNGCDLRSHSEPLLFNYMSKL